MAFFGLFAHFPAVGAVLSLAGYVLDPADVAAQMQMLAALLPPEAGTIVAGRMTEAAGASGTATGLGALFGFLLAICGAIRGVKTLMEGLDIACDARGDRGFLKPNPVAAGLTLLLAVGVIVALAALILRPPVVGLPGLPFLAQAPISAGKWAILTALVPFGLALVCRPGPSRPSPAWRWIPPGRCWRPCRGCSAPSASRSACSTSPTTTPPVAPSAAWSSCRPGKGSRPSPFCGAPSSTPRWSAMHGQVRPRDAAAAGRAGRGPGEG